MRLWDMPTRVFKAKESRAVHKTCSSAMETQRKTGSVSFNNYKIFRNGMVLKLYVAFYYTFC